MHDNVELIRKNTEKKILAVVKCNAYGLGIEDISSFLNNKVDGFVVGDIDEAVKIQSNKPILILLPDIADKELHLVKDNFILTIDSARMLEKLKDRPYTVHIFVDSGMHRFGIKPGEIKGIMQMIGSKYPNITVDGIYTHLNHPCNARYSRKQIATFKQGVEKYRHVIPNIHLLNSAGYLKYNDIDFDNCLRIGNLLYGYCAERYGFKKIFSYKAKLVSITQADRNQYIGYGNRYKTNKPTPIGVLGVGYIHGFNCIRNVKTNIFFNLIRTVFNSFKNNPLIFLNGKPVRIMGGSSMNFTQIDLNGLKIDEQAIFDIHLSPIIADTRISKKYLNK